MKKKVLYILTAGLLFSASLSFAQTQPTTGNPQTTPSTNFNSTNGSLNPVNSNALPDPLRSTLQGNQQYKGWESGQWYFNSTTNQYSVQMPQINSTTSTTPNPLGSTTTGTLGTPQSTSSSTIPTTTTTTSPVGTINPMSGLQPQQGTTLSPIVNTQPTWYQFDQTGKLIPKPN